ncbi:MAG TPA: Flp pilus assembly protein CpaB [Candidatus Limnocylindrales bacterium]|nr:Flp pilus assembly protein CpaB [Candidatus Limnocylindrales bacterium]
MDSGRRRRFVLMLLGVVLALSAAGGVYVLGQQNVSQPGEEVEMTDVLVASREIAARTTLTPDDVVVQSVPADAVLEQAYRSDERAIGRVTGVTIYPGQQITPNLFATAAADAPFDILGEDEEITDDSPYWRATAVFVPKERAVGGQLRAGQRVDLVVTVEFGQPYKAVLDPETGEVTYEEVPAIAVTDPDSGETEALTGGRSTRVAVPDLMVLQADPDQNFYILKVTLEQAEQIAHINQIAPDGFSLVLRPEQDNRTFDPGQYGETTDRIILKYVYPVPMMPDLGELLGVPIDPVIASPSPGEPEPGESPEPEPEPEPEPSPAP